MNDSVKTPPRPVGSDMSMDDILLSIRKIIATEENSKDIPPVPQHRPQTEVKPETVIQHRSLSHRDELSQISNLSFESERRAPQQQQQNYQPAPQQQQRAPEARMQQSYATHAPIPEATSVERQNVNDTSEILRTLEDIKRSLSPDAIRDAKNAQEFQQQTYPERQQAPVVTNELRKVTINNEQDMVDLRPTQFNAGEIPDFLKKFKRDSSQIQQTNNHIQEEPTATAPVYDFSQLSSFDEDDSIMELTKVMLPETQEEDTIQQIPQEFTAFDSLTNSDDGLSDAMEMLMIKSLRPMLQEWIHEHLTDVAEKIIREELLKKRYKK